MTENPVEDGHDKTPSPQADPGEDVGARRHSFPKISKIKSWYLTTFFRRAPYKSTSLENKLGAEKLSPRTLNYYSEYLRNKIKRQSD